MTSERRRFRFSLRTLVLFVAVCGSGYGLWVNWEPWQLVSVLNQDSAEVFSAAYSPDGKRIVTASGDMTASIWDAADGKPLAVLKGHSIAPWSAAYSPDGKRIVTASHDGTARIWYRRRPEYWWGVAWFPEFYLTLALTFALLWSVRRAWKVLATPDGM